MGIFWFRNVNSKYMFFVFNKQEVGYIITYYISKYTITSTHFSLNINVTHKIQLSGKNVSLLITLVRTVTYVWTTLYSLIWSELSVDMYFVRARQCSTCYKVQGYWHIILAELWRAVHTSRLNIIKFILCLCIT